MRTLKDQLDARIADGETRQAAKPGLYEGGDWWQLTDAESAVFAIDRDRFIRMIMTWHCYDAFKLIASDPEWDDNLIEQARRERPDWCGPDISVSEFSAFAQAFGDLTMREAYAIYHKHDFWLHRAGVATYADEHQPET